VLGGESRGLAFIYLVDGVREVQAGVSHWVSRFLARFLPGMLLWARHRTTDFRLRRGLTEYDPPPTPLRCFLLLAVAHDALLVSTVAVARDADMAGLSR